MARPAPDIFNDFLEALEVKHTRCYSRERFETMTFKSLFGFTRLLADYGIESEGLSIADKSELAALTPPFLAQTGGAFVIVTENTPDRVTYRFDGDFFTVSPDDFKKKWTGTVLLAFPTDTACEPDYARHRFLEIGEKVKTWLLGGSAAVLLVYLFVTAKLYESVALTLLTLLTLGGLYVSWLLTLKSLNIHSDAADSVCGVIEKEGCRTVLSTDASKFFGLFGWSEVGLAYFSVTLLTLLLFPGDLASLAALNVCCLPFSFWSVWYQKTRAKAWCTLCLTVQAILWLSFFCYLGSGVFHHIFPLTVHIIAIGLTYLATLLLINKLSPHFAQPE